MHDDTPRRPSGSWWVLGLGAALILVLARIVVLYGLEHLHHGVALELFTRRLSRSLPGVIGVALATGLGAALGAVLISSEARTRRSLALLALATGALGGALVAGRVASDGMRENRLGLDTTQGLVGNLVVFAAALVLGGLLVASVARSSAGGVGVGRRGRALGVVLALAMVLLPGATGALARRLRRPHELAEVVLDVPASEGAWVAFGECRGMPPLPPRAGMLTPSPQYELDGAGMRSLLVPPGTGVEFRVPDKKGYLWLVARAGFGPYFVLGTVRRGQAAVAHFALEVDGERLWSHAVPVLEDVVGGASEWTDVGGERGFLLAPGATVRLTTELRTPDGEPYPWDRVRDRGQRPGRIPMLSDIGFGGVVLERRSIIARQPSSPEKPNIVFVVMDTLRADRLSAYGYGRPTSPRLEQLAARGLLAERAYSTASWTWPSTASLFTGRLPEEHGVVSNEECFLEYGYETLAESLAREGFTTGAFSGNPLIVPDKNFDQGFELFEHGKAGIMESEEVLPRALEWIEDHAEERFFAYIHLMDPHAPQLPQSAARELLAADVPEDFSPVACNTFHGAALGGAGRDARGHMDLDAIAAPEERQWVSDLYDACVRSGDERLGEVLDTLERLGLTGSTLVAFTSDHGEELFDHGFVTHGQSVYQELVHVPLVIAGPGVPAGVRLAEPLSNRHLAPTLARLSGAELEGGYRSFDLIERLDADAAEDVLMFHTANGWWQGSSPTPIYALQSGRLVLHWAPAAGAWGSTEAPPGGSWTMFDLAQDAGELRDVAEAQAEDALALRRRLGELQRELRGRRVEAASVGVGEDTLLMLRGIGYIGDDE